ncbi:Alpha/beta hydrolase fold-3 [Cordyceps fumosorosea ARSEF 2679]|uniref:Alpha/beta hydrolase fold-3 n=1 Tax=Cordyceps fumosorosea (strain ARSEF 2679) TaxID=1081104 RepID=A0A167LMA7_CORFA|nr:Alpha/beta hydrolase fold-3 [Cordyceps fumosorosea ARSEF 2679]OAA53256.1 Alpha/beta hydrolase fold-3 [Cordyceps fumosorosea ARSEF 2679]
MAYPFSSRLTVHERARLVLLLLCIVPLRLTIELSRTLLNALIHRLPLRLFLTGAVFRVVLDTLEARHIQHLSKSTRATYQSWVQRKQARLLKSTKSERATRCSVDIEVLDDDGSALLWLGNRQTAQRVVLFLHGGGYLVPLSPGHLEWCWEVFVTTQFEAGVETAVAILEYTLCPSAAFPVQLTQAASGLAHILSTGVLPRNIICGGDSAGGNLTMQLLAHLIDPHPGVHAVRLAEPFQAAFMVSPWLSMKTGDASFRKSHGIDILSASIVQTSVHAILGEVGQSPRRATVEEREGAFPFDKDGCSFLSRLPDVIARIYVSVGQYEVLRDQIVALALEAERRAPTLDVQLDKFEKQAHDFILLEGMIRSPGEATNAMITWLRR